MSKFTLNNFYKSKEWIVFRQNIIGKRVNHRSELICEHCGRQIIRKYDCILHHKEELTEANVNDVNISLNPDNIMMIHFDCHNEIHDRFGSGKQEVYIIYGSPCSGKNAYVSSIVKRNDIVVDMDMIYNMINPHNELYDKPDRLYLVVLSIYNRMLECVRDRLGKWQRAYIITTENLPTQLDRMCEMYGAKLIHIDTDKETCIANLMEDKMKYSYRDKWLKYIDKYWLTYTPYL